MSSVWGMILQWGSTIKVSLELPVATRHRRDMTEKLLKATLNTNKQQQQYLSWTDSIKQSLLSPRPAHSFVETWSWKHFYGHSPSSSNVLKGRKTEIKPNQESAVVNLDAVLPNDPLFRLLNDVLCIWFMKCPDADQCCTVVWLSCTFWVIVLHCGFQKTVLQMWFSYRCSVLSTGAIRIVYRWNAETTITHQ